MAIWGSPGVAVGVAEVAVEVGAAVVFVTANQLLILVTCQSVNSAL